MAFEVKGAGQTNDVPRRKWSSAVPRWSVIGIFLYLSIFALAYAQLFFIPVVLAFLLSMVFSPVRRVLNRIGLPQGASAVIIVSVLFAGLFIIISTLAMPVNGWINNAPRIEYKLQKRLGEISGPFSEVFEAQEKLDSVAKSDTPGVQQVQTQNTSLTTRVAAYVPTMITQFVFTLVLLIFLLASGDMFYEKLVHTLPTFRDKKRAARIVHEIEHKLSRYLLTITVINAGLGTAVGLAMWAMGMPSPLLFGVIAFLFNFVPYLGAFMGVLIAGLVALVTFQWVGWSLVVAGIYLGLTSVEGQFITPYFVGRSLRLNTVVVFVTISFWAWLWSAVGMIVAVPLLVTVKTFGEHFEGLAPLSDFLSQRHGELDISDGTRPEASS